MGVVMAETVNIPGIGPVDQRWAVAGVALVVGIVGYAWWRRASVTVDETAEITPESDAFHEASVDAYEGAFGTAALTPHPVSGSGTLPPSTDAEWARRAQDILTRINYDPVIAAAAIGKYIGRQPLTPAEAEIVRVAIAQLGPPPVGSYPVTVLEGTKPPTAGTPPPATPPATGTPSGPQWQGKPITANWPLAPQYSVGRHVLGGTPGVALPWAIIAAKSMRAHMAVNPANINAMVSALKRANPELARRYPVAVPNTNAVTIPAVPGINAPK